MYDFGCSEEIYIYIYIYIAIRRRGSSTFSLFKTENYQLLRECYIHAVYQFGYRRFKELHSDYRQLATFRICISNY